jgi:hypothetical protein
MGDEVTDDINKVAVAIAEMRGEFSTKLARIEERQEASKEAADHRHKNAVMALDGLARKFEDTVSRKELDPIVRALENDHGALEIRVVKIEDAQALLANTKNRTALYAGGAGSGVGAAVYAGLELLAKKMGWV